METINLAFVACIGAVDGRNEQQILGFKGSGISLDITAILKMQIKPREQAEEELFAPVLKKYNEGKAE